MGAPTQERDQYIFIATVNWNIHIFLHSISKAEVEVVGV